MKREGLIEVIDRLRGDSLEVGERARLLGIIHFQAAVGHMAPIPVRATLRRGLSCAALVIRRFGFVPKEDSRRFRQAELLVGMTMVYVTLILLFIGSFYPVVWLLGWISKNFGIEIVGFAFVGTIVPFLLMMRMLTHRGPTKVETYQRFGVCCIGCGYKLEGLESALGDELWVGPAVCPECGLKYPAVGF